MLLYLIESEFFFCNVFITCIVSINDCVQAPNFSLALVVRKWNMRKVPDGFHLKEVISLILGGEMNRRSV